MRPFLLMLLLAPALAYAAEQAAIGVYVINAGKFDPQSGSYTVDFYLSYTCPQNCSPDFEFINGRALSVEKVIDEPAEKFYRIQASLQDPVDFRRFPFDSHDLTIEIEDKERTKDELAFTVDDAQSGVEPSIQFVGWKLDGYDAKVEDHYYPPYGETFSKYTFTMGLERETISSLLKVFAPVFFIMLLNFFAHFPDPDKIATRITLHSSFLIAAVMFHVAIGNQLPPVGYLTVADKFMFAAYIPLAFSLFSAIVVLELSEEKKGDVVRKVHRASGVASFLLWLAGLAFVLLTM
ncbi:MAG: hypothetical protein AB1529_00620 [Candidatus Micrarchaeota archaeon]